MLNYKIGDIVTFKQELFDKNYFDVQNFKALVVDIKRSNDIKINTTEGPSTYAEFADCFLISKDSSMLKKLSFINFTDSQSITFAILTTFLQKAHNKEE